MHSYIQMEDRHRWLDVATPLSSDELYQSWHVKLHNSPRGIDHEEGFYATGKDGSVIRAVTFLPSRETHAKIVAFVQKRLASLPSVVAWRDIAEMKGSLESVLEKIDHIQAKNGGKKYGSRSEWINENGVWHRAVCIPNYSEARGKKALAELRTIIYD